MNLTSDKRLTDIQKIINTCYLNESDGKSFSFDVIVLLMLRRSSQRITNSLYYIGTPPKLSQHFVNCSNDSSDLDKLFTIYIKKN